MMCSSYNLTGIGKGVQLETRLWQEAGSCARGEDVAQLEGFSDEQTGNGAPNFD